MAMKRPPRPPYPGVYLVWHKIFDGNTWCLTKGVDFNCTLNTMVEQVHKQAVRYMVDYECSIINKREIHVRAILDNTGSKAGVKNEYQQNRHDSRPVQGFTEGVWAQYSNIDNSTLYD